MDLENEFENSIVVNINVEMRFTDKGQTLKIVSNLSEIVLFHVYTLTLNYKTSLRTIVCKLRASGI